MNDYIDLENDVESMITPTIILVLILVCAQNFTESKPNLKTSPIELSKKQALAVMKESAIARTAIYQWNKLNTTVRMLVHKTKVSQQ